MEEKKMYRIEYLPAGALERFSDIALLSLEEAKQIEARLSKTTDDHRIEMYSWEVREIDSLGDFAIMAELMTDNGVPELAAV
jgi:hypothetical protein